MFTPTRITALSVPAVALLLYLAGVEVGVVAAIATGLFGLAPKLIEEQIEKDKTKKEKVRELVQGDHYMNPFLVSVMIIFYLLFIQFSAGLLIGYSISFVTAQVESPELAAFLPGALLSYTLIIFIAKYATHRIEKYPFLWICAAVIVSGIINLIIAATFLHISTNFWTELIGLLLYLPGIIIGYFWAKRTQDRFVITSIFKQLDPADRKDLIDLALTVPGVDSN